MPRSISPAEPCLNLKTKSSWKGKGNICWNMDKRLAGKENLLRNYLILPNARLLQSLILPISLLKKLAHISI